MLKHNLLAIMLAVPVFVCCGCFSHSGVNPGPVESRPSAQLLAHELTTRDPVKDLHGALAHGDKRFIAVKTFTTYIPGLEVRGELTEKFGMKMIQDITDTSGIDEATVEQAMEYAQIYNLLLYRALRARGEATWISTGPSPASQPSR